MLLPWDERMLLALAHFDRETFGSIHDTPKGVGPATVDELVEIGLVERDGADGFRATAAGRGVLQADVPALALNRAAWPPLVGEPTAAPMSVEAKPKPPIPAKKLRRSSLLVTQKQVAAVMKGAAQAGIQVEVRIENGVVRFIPCTPEAAPTRSVGVDKRTRVHL